MNLLLFYCELLLVIKYFIILALSNKNIYTKYDIIKLIQRIVAGLMYVSFYRRPF